jgi:myo-inositol 2-dehydrogenase / D-chiro-inositol 1-dehydrogenase
MNHSAHSDFSRRAFVKSAGLFAAALAAGPLILPRRLLGADAPSRKINIGLIGMGRQMLAMNMSPFLKSPDCQVVAVCDVDAWRMEQCLNVVNKHYAKQRGVASWNGCKTYADWRDLIADKDIDAVCISTPDHWHAPMAIAAVRAGKDVSLEKPITRYIDEGRILATEAAKHQRVFRVDSEFRSIPSMHRAAELVRNGFIGKLHTVRTGSPTEQFPNEPAIEAPVPAGLDYEMWLGPAPLVPYMQKRVHAPNDLKSRPGWMRNLDYCDGMITNWGTHLNDIAQWGAGTERTGPVEIEATGNYHDDKVWNVLEKFDVRYRFADGMQLYYQMGAPHVRFEGEKGWVQVNYGATKLMASGVHASSPEILNAVIPPDGIRFPLKHEKQDFIDSIKTRGQTLEDAEVGQRTTSLCHLGQIAIQLGGAKLAWDPAKEEFTGNAAANKLTKRPPLRGPWTL